MVVRELNVDAGNANARVDHLAAVPNYYKPPPRYDTSCPRDSSCAVSQLLLT